MSEYVVDSRIRVLLLAKILYEKSDENTGLTAEQLIDELQAAGMRSERKTLYKDLESLIFLGHDIVKNRRGRDVYYHIGSRRFEIAELRLLIDAVQASHFLTPGKTKALIRKLEFFASENESKDFENIVYVSGQRKATNESIYYLVNDLHIAIKDNHKVAFQYFQWDINKKPKLRHDGKVYEVSPWAMLFDYENYYLLAYNSESNDMRHYRVDKMKNIRILDESRDGGEKFEEYDMSTFTQSIFGMYDARTEHVVLRVNSDLVGVMVDRFGKEIEINENANGTIDIEVDVRVSDHFLGWIIAIGPGVEILEPETVRTRMMEIGQRLDRTYH